MHYVYVLQSLRENRKLYVGRTSDLRERLKQHQARKTWTTQRMLPVRLIFYEAFYIESDAIRREHYFKSSKGKSSLKQVIRDSISFP